ncbi:hypothetical protein BH09DEP1_BH09DEP1_6910 [soil metagenome]
MKNNCIEKIAETDPIEGLRINLLGNPLKSITIEKPELCNYLKFTTDKTDLKVDFAQDNYSRKMTWFKSLWAKAKLAREYFLPTTTVLLCCAGAGIIWKLATNFPKNPFEPKVNMDRFVVVVNKNLFMTTSVDEGQYWLRLAKTIDPEATLTTLKEVAHLLPVPPVKEIIQQTLFQKWFLAPAKTGLKCMEFFGGLAMAYHFLFEESIMDFPYAIGFQAQRNPYRVRIKANDTVIGDFPSNYTYNLFGKF